MSHITEQEEATLAASTLAAASLLSAEEVAAQLAAFDAYRAIASVLLDEPGSDSALLYLRGLARIGLDSEPESEMQATLHRRVMAVLALAGAVPLTPDEFEAELRAAAQSITYQFDPTGTPPADLQADIIEGFKDASRLS